MPVIPVTSLEAPELSPYRQIKGRDPKEQGVFIVESEMLVRRAIESPLEVVSLLCADRISDRISATVNPSIPLFVAPEHLINELLGFNFHRGIMACVRRPSMSEMTLDRLLPARTLIVCPFLTQNENLGLILRAVAGLGADGILISDRGADPFSRQAVRVCTGACFHFPIAISADIQGDLRRLKEREEMQIVSTILSPTATPLHLFKRPPRVALLVGNEFEGLDADSLALCDHHVTIPMHHHIDSLNVAMATGIVLHHLINASEMR